MGAKRKPIPKAPYRAKRRKQAPHQHGSGGGDGGGGIGETIGKELATLVIGYGLNTDHLHEEVKNIFIDFVYENRHYPAANHIIIGFRRLIEDLYKIKYSDREVSLDEIDEDFDIEKLLVNFTEALDRETNSISKRVEENNYQANKINAFLDRMDQKLGL